MSISFASYLASFSGNWKTSKPDYHIWHNHCYLFCILFHNVERNRIRFQLKAELLDPITKKNTSKTKDFKTLLTRNIKAENFTLNQIPRQSQTIKVTIALYAHPSLRMIQDILIIKTQNKLFHSLLIPNPNQSPRNLFCQRVLQTLLSLSLLSTS